MIIVVFIGLGLVMSVLIGDGASASSYSAEEDRANADLGLLAMDVMMIRATLC